MHVIVCVFVCVYVCVYMCVCVCVCMLAWVCTCMHVCMHINGWVSITCSFKTFIPAIDKASAMLNGDSTREAHEYCQVWNPQDSQNTDLQYFTGNWYEKQSKQQNTHEIRNNWLKSLVAWLTTLLSYKFTGMSSIWTLSVVSQFKHQLPSDGSIT